MHAITSYGVAADLPFYTVCNRIMLMMMMPIIGLMRALQPVTGMNYGAENYARVIRSYWLFVFCGVCIVTPFWLIMSFFPEVMISSMLPGFKILPQQINSFRIYLGILPFLPIVFMCMVTLPSIGHAKETSILAMLRQVVFYFPLMIFAPRYFGAGAVYWGSTLIDAIVILISLFFLQKYFKKLNRNGAKKISLIPTQ